MVSRVNTLKLNFFIVTLLSLTLSLLIFIATSRLENSYHHHHNHHNIKTHNGEKQSQSSTMKKKSSSSTLDFIKRELKGKGITKIGLLNIDDNQEEEDQWEEELGGKTSLVNFDRISKDSKWKDFFPEWIDEEEKWRSPSCMEIPMPIFENYDEFDVVVSKLPCSSKNGSKYEIREGIRDVFRLQINLIVANLVVRNGGWRNKMDGLDRSVYVVFIGSCGPMWELFRLDDLMSHNEKVWIYKPDLKRLQQKVLMPVGTCQLGLNYKKQGKEKLNQSLSKLITRHTESDNPREAYVTMLHSSESYVCGAIALARSILQTNSTKDLVILVDKSISETSLRGLRAAGWKTKQIERIRSPLAEKDAYNKWNYSKLRIWQLTEYTKIMFIDSDLVVLKNMDEFFEYPQLSAVGNDKVLFNSGLMVIEPSDRVFEMLMKKRFSIISYNGGDQGFLNEAFTWWHRLPIKLNFLKNFDNGSDTEHLLPESVYAVHYLGLKPWTCYRDYDCNWDKVDHIIYASDSANDKWWEVYDKMPKKLQKYCDLSEKMDFRIKKWRKIAENGSLPNQHWKIKVKDPRQLHR